MKADGETKRQSEVQNKRSMATSLAPEAPKIALSAAVRRKQLNGAVFKKKT